MITPALQQKIEEKIEDIKHQLEIMPGVVIIHNIHTSVVVYMSSGGLKTLNVTLQELRDMGTEYYPRFFNEEDAADYVPKVLGLLERNNDEETISFFQQMRPRPEMDWEWYVCGTRIFMRDDNGVPLLTITSATPIEPSNYYISKIERMLDEKTAANKGAHLLASLTGREKQILLLMARDCTSRHIAQELSIAEDTVKTHRRNIKKKLGLNNQYDVLRFAQTFDLI